MGSFPSGHPPSPEGDASDRQLGHARQAMPGGRFTYPDAAQLEVALRLRLKAIWLALRSQGGPTSPFGSMLQRAERLGGVAGMPSSS